MGRPSRHKIGQKCFNLTVDAVIGRGPGKHVLLVCTCDCGRSTSIDAVNWGKMKSCGCKRLMRLKRKRKEFYKPWQLPQGEASFNGLFHSYRLSAKRTKKAFRLSKKKFRELVTANCHYCGAEPSREFGTNMRYNGTFRYNGIDRMNSKRGYTNDNVCTACFTCNWSKLHQTAEEFVSHCKRVADRYFPVCAGLLEGEVK